MIRHPYIDGDVELLAKNIDWILSVYWLYKIIDGWYRPFYNLLFYWGCLMKMYLFFFKIFVRRVLSAFRRMIHVCHILLYINLYSSCVLKVCWYLLKLSIILLGNEKSSRWDRDDIFRYYSRETSNRCRADTVSTFYHFLVLIRLVGMFLNLHITSHIIRSQHLSVITQRPIHVHTPCALKWWDRATVTVNVIQSTNREGLICPKTFDYSLVQ